VLRPSISVAALFMTACLGAASVNLAQPAKLSERATTPSQFDYLVLASMADAQRPLSMAAYQPGHSQPSR
jgi:hypothetical protein